MKDNKVFAIIKKVLWGIFLAVFGLVAVVTLWLAVDKFVLKSPVPSMFGYSALTVKTGSMAGTIEMGDMIIIHKEDDYKIGDVITYLHEGDKIPTTHRIININQNDGSFLTRGDANNTKDPEAVTEDIILGKMVKIYPKAGIFMSWVQTEGWIYIVACLAILGLGVFVINSDNQPVKESIADAPKDTLHIENNGEDSSNTETDTKTNPEE